MARLLQVPERMLPLAETYLRIVGSGIVFTSVTSTLTTIIRNTGDTRSPMFIATGMNLIHIVLNYGFIFGAFGLPQLGLAGVAESTLVSRALAAAALVHVARAAFRTVSPLRVRDLFRFDRGLFGETVKIGMPMAIGSATWSVAQMVLYSLVASMGAVPLTAKTYMSTIESFPIVAGWSIGMALQIQVAHLHGAGRHEEAYRSPFRGFRAGMALVMTITFVMLLAIKPILHLFTSSSEVITVCGILMLLNLVYQPCKMTNMAFNTALTAVSDTRYIMITNLIFIWSVCVGLSYVLGHMLGMGIIGVYAALILDEGIRCVLVYRRWKTTYLTPPAGRNAPSNAVNI